MNEPIATICVVEDDEKLAELLCNQLVRFGYQPYRVTDFQKVEDEVILSKASLVLLDINLPFYDGFYWCRKIRLHSKIPIVFLSARSGEMDQVLALESGGDDYITKPFHPDVFLAKIRALLRRTYGEYAEVEIADADTVANADAEVTDIDKRVAKLGSSHPIQLTEILQFSGLELNVRRATIQYQGHTVSLTVTELELLRQLIEARGRIVSRDELLSALWDDTQFVDDNTLTVNVTRVRRKLSELGLPSVILTVRGLGYRLELTDQPIVKDTEL